MGFLQYFVALLGSSGLYAPQAASSQTGVSMAGSPSSHSLAGRFLLAVETTTMASAGDGLLARRNTGGGPALRRRHRFTAAVATSSPPSASTSTTTTTSFVSRDGTTTLDCHDAAGFALVGHDQLLVAGQPVSASPRTNPYQPLVGHQASDGPVNRGFSLVRDSTHSPPTQQGGGGGTSTNHLDGSVLQWSDSQFSGGAALFCLAADGIVYAVFSPSSMPSRCTPVTLRSVPYSHCAGRNTHPVGDGRHRHHPTTDDTDYIDQGGEYEGSRFDGGYGQGRGSRYGGGYADGYGRPRGDVEGRDA